MRCFDRLPKIRRPRNPWVNVGYDEALLRIVGGVIVAGICGGVLMGLVWGAATLLEAVAP